MKETRAVLLKYHLAAESIGINKLGAVTAASYGHDFPADNVI